jgi:hypothetical protein
MITIRIFLLVAVFTMLTGCASESWEAKAKRLNAEQDQREANEKSVREARWQVAYFGEKLDDSVYLTAVENSLKISLIDPDSLKLACDNARKGWVDKGFSLIFWMDCSL